MQHSTRTRFRAFFVLFFSTLLCCPAHSSFCVPHLFPLSPSLFFIIMICFVFFNEQSKTRPLRLSCCVSVDPLHFVFFFFCFPTPLDGDSMIHLKQNQICNKKNEANTKKPQPTRMRLRWLSTELGRIGPSVRIGPQIKKK